jgi:hypothetical protein
VADGAGRVVVLHRGRAAFDGSGDAFAAAGSGDVTAAFAAVIAASEAGAAD